MKTILAILVFSTILSNSAYAMHATVAFGPKIGTQGIGAEVRAPLADNFFGRLGLNYFTYKHNLNSGKINLRGKLTLLTVPIMLDWHPFAESGFRLSAGVAYNGNKVTAKATPSRPITIDGVTYSVSEIGAVSSKLTLGNAISGIATLGYDSSFFNNSPWSFNCEAGIMYAGNPRVSVTSTGNGGASAKAAVEKDVKKGVNDAKKYLRLFPVLSLGLKYAL